MDNHIYTELDVMGRQLHTREPDTGGYSEITDVTDIRSPDAVTSRPRLDVSTIDDVYLHTVEPVTGAGSRDSGPSRMKCCVVVLSVCVFVLAIGGAVGGYLLYTNPAKSELVIHLYITSKKRCFMDKF